MSFAEADKLFSMNLFEYFFYCVELPVAGVQGESQFGERPGGQSRAEGVLETRLLVAEGLQGIANLFLWEDAHEHPSVAEIGRCVNADHGDQDPFFPRDLPLQKLAHDGVDELIDFDDAIGHRRGAIKIRRGNAAAIGAPTRNRT